MCGVDINLRGLNSVMVLPDGHSADIQGGVLTKEVTDALWGLGKWTGEREDYQSLITPRSDKM
jgi:hypothetical protein